ILYEAARTDHAGKLRDTTLVVRALRGGGSGGPLRSMQGQLDDLRADPGPRRVVGDPYALSPERASEPRLGAERELAWPLWDGELGMWLGPFAMAAANTRVVRRSNALLGWAYGRRFRYREAVGFGTGRSGQLKATAMSVGLASLVGGLGF